MFKRASKTFLTGLLAILPIGLTFYLLFIIVDGTESLLKKGLEGLFPQSQFYFPGMGIVVCVILIFSIGVMLNSWVIRTIFRIFDGILKRIPLVKTLYGAVTDLMGLFSGSEDRGLSQVVMVRIGESDARLLGFLTRSDFSDLPDGIGEEGKVAVYLPMSYQLGGFTTIVPRESVEPVDMSLEDAMRFAIAAGVQEKKIES